MKIFEIGTGYTTIPAQMGAATEIVIEELTKSLLKMGKDVTIVDIRAENRVKTNLPIIEVAVPKKFTGTDVQLGVMHKLKRVVYSISLSFKLKNILRTTREKVIFHFHNQYNMYFFLKLTPKRLREKCVLVYTNHSYIWHGEWNEIEQIVKKKYFQEIYAMRHSDRIYVLNDITRKTLICYLNISKDKIQLINNGVNINIYRPLAENKKNIAKQKYGVIDKTVFAQIGSVCDRKNQLGALQLLMPILKENKEYSYIYAGGIIDNEYQRKIQDYAKKNGIEHQVKYLGELKPGEGLNECYAISKAMIFPSKSEGFSLVIIEAMAAGIPVIIPGNLQFNLADECCRFWCKRDFYMIIKNNILNEENYQNISNRARFAVVENYSWDKIADAYYQSWEKL